MDQRVVIHLDLEVQDMVEEARWFLEKYYPSRLGRIEANLSRIDHHQEVSSY
jgi:hypothetical protein